MSLVCILQDLQIWTQFPYGLANQNLCYIQMLLNVRKICKTRLRTFSHPFKCSFLSKSLFFSNISEVLGKKLQDKGCLNKVSIVPQPGYKSYPSHWRIGPGVFSNYIRLYIVLEQSITFCCDYPDLILTVKQKENFSWWSDLSGNWENFRHSTPLELIV